MRKGTWDWSLDKIIVDKSGNIISGHHRVLAADRELHAALEPRGVLFSSNPRGPNHEGWSGDRYGCYHDLPAWSAFVAAAGFEAITHYYRPEGRSRDQQPWLATVWRKS